MLTVILLIIIKIIEIIQSKYHWNLYTRGVLKKYREDMLALYILNLYCSCNTLWRRRKLEIAWCVTHCEAKRCQPSRSVSSRQKNHNCCKLATLLMITFCIAATVSCTIRTFHTKSTKHEICVAVSVISIAAAQKKY